MVTLIGIAGGTCSGKDIAVNNIIDEMGKDNVSVINQDAYYKPLPEGIDPLKYNFDSPSAIDWELLLKHVVLLINGTCALMPIYDFNTHSRTLKYVKVESTNVIIVQGIMVLLNNELRSMMDLKVFVHADSDVRLARRIKRDVTHRGRTIDSVIEQYFKTVKLSHYMYIEPTKELADITIMNNKNDVLTGVYKLCMIVNSIKPKNNINHI